MIPNAAAPLTIGSFGNGNALDGLIDEVMIFDRALAPTEIQAIYDAASAGLIVYAEDGTQSIAEWGQILFPEVPPGGSPEFSFATSNSSQALFTDRPEIDSTGRLTFTPAPNSKGIARVTVVMHTAGPEGETGGEGDDTTAVFTITIEQRYPWQNDILYLDVNNNTFVVAEDALWIINYLNITGSGPVPVSADPAVPFVDTSGDNYVSPGDALMVINYINQQGTPAAEGESLSGEGLIAESSVADESPARAFAATASDALGPPDRLSPAVSLSEQRHLDLLIEAATALLPRRRRVW